MIIVFYFCCQSRNLVYFWYSDIFNDQSLIDDYYPNECQWIVPGTLTYGDFA